MCTYHATPNRSLFLSYKTGKYVSVKKGNYGEYKIVGMENIRLKLKLSSLFLKNVRYVLECEVSFRCENESQVQGIT